jgi:hypothetical protein
VTTFCSFFPIIESFFPVLPKSHLAFVVKVSQLILSGRTAKISSLAQEVNALSLIHRQSKLPVTIIHGKITHSFWILELNSLACPRQMLLVGTQDRFPAESTCPFFDLRAVLIIATMADRLATAWKIRV